MALTKAKRREASGRFGNLPPMSLPNGRVNAMRFHLSFDMDNDAFDGGQGDPAAEVSWLLRRLAVRVQREPLVPGEGGPIHDSNGATVGQWFVAGDERCQGCRNGDGCYGDEGTPCVGG